MWSFYQASSSCRPWNPANNENCWVYWLRSKSSYPPSEPGTWESWLARLPLYALYWSNIYLEILSSFMSIWIFIYFFSSLFQVPYKIKDVEQDYDNYNQVPESPIGRDEEPHLYMVPKKYRKVGPILHCHNLFCCFFVWEFWFVKNVTRLSLCSIRSQLNTPNLAWRTLTSNITTEPCLLAWSLTSLTPTVTAWSRFSSHF